MRTILVLSAIFAQYVRQILTALCTCLLAILLIPPASAGRIEAGSFTAHDTFSTTARAPVRISFQQSFDVTPVVIVLGSSQGGDAGTVRVTNVSTTGFDELIVESDNFDGRHVAMTTYYIAVEPGRHVLPDGSVIEAGFTITSATQFGSGFTGGTASWANVAFSAPMPSTPTVVHQPQTANSETQNVANAPSRPFLTTVARSLSSSGFQLALERSQANSGPFPSAETIGWIAFPAGATGTFPDIGGASVTWSAVNTSANIRGWNDGCFSNSFGQTSGTRIAVAKKISRNNPDGGWFRFCNLNSTNIELRVDEDRDQDNERALTQAQAEQAGIIAFSRPFHANLQAELDIMKVNFATTGPHGDFKIPGATVEYLITVINNGNAPPNYDSVIITEQIPADLALVLTDFAGPGSGPLHFTDGSPATGLTCTFISLASNSDCYSFSTDGTNFNYTPVDNGDGTDPAVTHVRIVPSGYMAGDSGSGSPGFQLRLRAKVR
jgi:uncharacterized repeat protein (TIGR01451 family)